MPDVRCSYCEKKFPRPKNRINENIKLGRNSYCSKNCLALSRYKQIVVACENCRKKFERQPNHVSPHNYCSSSCAATVNNTNFPKRGPGFRICKTCLQKFKGSNLYCSKICWKKSRIRNKPQDLIETIKSTNMKLGRVPAKREVSQLAAACVYAFGSWNKAIIAAGLNPNRSHENRMYKRAMTKAKDGHSCDSISEALIDNWLTDNGIKHIRDFPYPDSGHKADWAIGGSIFIEYFGLAKDSLRYDRDIETKKKLCRKHNIKLIEIYPKDLYPQLNPNDDLRALIVVNSN